MKTILLIVILFLQSIVCWSQQPTIASRLLLPSNYEQLRVLNPVFSWVPTGSSLYNLKLAQLVDGQSPYMALMTNPLLLNIQVASVTTNYPLTAPMLKVGNTYVWQVCSVSGETQEVCSEMWQFSITDDSLDTQDLPKFNIFPRLSTTGSGTVYKVRNNYLPFFIEGEYIQSTLVYEVISSKREKVKSDTWEERLFNYGSNRYVLKLKGVESGSYTLVVTDLKGTKYYLNFVK